MKEMVKSVEVLELANYKDLTGSLSGA